MKSMKQNVFLAVMALLFSVAAYADSIKSAVVDGSSLQWREVADLPPGAKIAILSGNPEKKEFYVARIMLPANYAIPLHSHPVNEYDTVISGTLFLRMGNKKDPASNLTLPAGSFIKIPAKLMHYVWTEEQTILQITGVGPWGMIYKK